MACGSVITAALAVWFLLTVVCQFSGSWTDWLRRFDVVGLIPSWRFFAPVPATGDFHLLYRDRLPDGSLSQWKELYFSETYRWWHMVWNPNRRGKKALFDLTTEL